MNGADTAFGKDFISARPAQQAEILEDLDYELANACGDTNPRHLQEFLQA